MKLSVALITFNHEEYIAQAMESVLMQKVNFDYEIVIGEDCSTDRTRMIVQDFQRKNPEKIRLLLHEKNSGGRNFTMTVQACRGQYIATLDGDDYWTSEHKLQKQVDFLDGHPECAMCSHNVSVVHEDGKQQPYDANPGNQKEISALEDLLSGRLLLYTPTLIFRRQSTLEIPEWYYATELSDWALSIVIAQYGKIGYINEVMAAYRVHSRGVWSKLNRVRQIEKEIHFYENIRRYLSCAYDDAIKTGLTKSYYGLVREYERQRNWEKATDCLRENIAKHPEWMSDMRDCITFWVSRDELRYFIDRKQLEAAEAIYQLTEMRSENPSTDPEWNYLTAFCLHSLQNNLQEALVRYNRAMDYGYDEFWVRYNRGSLHMELGNLKEAREDLERAIELKPAHKGAMQALQAMSREKKKKRFPRIF